MYRLYKSAFKKQNFEEAGNTREYWMKQPAAKRFRAAWHLTCAACGIDPENTPKMDKTVFSKRRHDAVK